MNYYIDKQYSEDLPLNAKKDLKTLFFNSLFKRSKNILDIGCSVGRIISLDPRRIEGIDYDREALEICSKKGFKIKYSDVRKKLPFKDESFDGVYCSQIIEHLENPLHLVKEIRRILKKGGKGVIITPDYIMTSRKYKVGFWSDYTHKTPFIPESLKRIAFDADFKNNRVYHFPGKGFRNLLRRGLITKELLIKLEKLPFTIKGRDLVLEVVK